jgi:hypothetical protein
MRNPQPANFLILIAFLFLLLFGSGCASIVVSAMGTGASMGIPYVLTASADRTLNFSFEDVNEATPKVLKKMDLVVVNQSQLKNGERIVAAADELDITIDMEVITKMVTKVSIDAKKGNFVKDKATAEEIINQLEKTLAQKMVREPYKPYR